MRFAPSGSQRLAPRLPFEGTATPDSAPLRGDIEVSVSEVPDKSCPIERSPLDFPAPGRGRIRSRVALLGDYMSIFGGGYEEQLRNAFDEACTAAGVDLLLVYGRPVESGAPEHAGHNAIFDLITPDSVDGVIVQSSPLAAICGQSGMVRYLERFADMPRCSIGMAVPGVWSVLVDGRAGVRSMVSHLVDCHGARRVAFIGGPDNSFEATERFEAYRGALLEAGLPFEPARVVGGHFTRVGGAAAMEELLGRGVAIDAVVAASDAMALGAIEVVHAAGMSVPRDIPVTGFDDLAAARLGTPALSTVAQPFSDIASAALAAIRDQMAGHSYDRLTTLAPRAVVRQSCGCGWAPDSIESDLANSGEYCDSPSVSIPALPVAQSMAARVERLRLPLTRALDASFPDAGHVARSLLDAVVAECRGQKRSIIRVVESILRHRSADSERHMALQRTMTCLREQFRPESTPQLEDTWHQVRDLIATVSTSALIQSRLDLQFMNLRLLALSDRLSTTLDTPALRAVLLDVLPSLGVDAAFVSRFVSRDSSELSPVVCMQNRRPWDVARRSYAASELLPPGGFGADMQRTMVVFPLAIDSECQGVAGFEYSSDVMGHCLLRDQIAAALRNIILHQSIVERTLLHDRSVQDRVATSRRLQALSVLAGSVAHDLNNVLGPLVALPDTIVADIEAHCVAEGVRAELRADAEAIKTGSLRASQIVKDLLTLGRQGRTARQPIDLRALVEACAAQSHIVGQSGELDEVRIEVSCDAGMLTVRGSEAQLARAMTNLLRHAARASSDGGAIEVRVCGVSLSDPKSGYELIEPGDYVLISVTSRGQSISAEELERLFEPYFTQSRAIADAGSGLGLAIVHAVVKEHDGFIDVDTASGQDTVFDVYLPRSADALRPSQWHVQRARVPARILVVDDEPVQLRTARRVLGLLGYQVDSLSSGKKALDAFRSAVGQGASPYDLILMDMILNEEKDGLEVFEDIQRLFPRQRAIVVSGHAPTERAKRANERGVLWLAKPYTTDALSRAIAAVLDRSEEA